MKDWTKPHFTAIQPFKRTTEFFALRDIRMKEVLTNHQKMLDKHKDIFKIEFIYAMGMSDAEYIQIIDFMAEDMQAFHEFMNDLKKINAPFMDFEDAVIGLAEVKHYPSVWGVKDLEKEVDPEIRQKFERRGKVWVTAPDINLADMIKEGKYLAKKKNYRNPVWEYPIDKYGWNAFKDVTKPKKNRFGDWPRMVSIQYTNHTPDWWTLPEHERGQRVLKHKTLLKKYIKHIDRKTVYLSGMSDTEFVTIFEYPFENAQIFHQMFYDLMRYDAPFIDLERSITGIAGIGDYWLEQLEDVDIKDVAMEDMWGRQAEIGSPGELPSEQRKKRDKGAEAG
jgi:chlorite dismutase